MRFAAVALALCACNQVFGLEHTIALPTTDAAYFDAPADAPFACPPIGQTPQFSRLFHQLPQTCSEYTASVVAGRAIAMCFEPTMQIAQGPIDAPLEQIAGFETAAGTHFDAPRMFPEGNQLIIRDWNSSTVVGRISVYDRDPPTSQLTYSHEITLPNNLATESFVRYGSASHGPQRRMFVRQGSLPLAEIEVDETGASQLVSTYMPSDFAVTDLFGLPPSLSADGLRMVFLASSAENGIFYADRPTLADRFSAARLLMDVPSSNDAYMTDDCQRIYFSALGSVLWVQQQ